MKLTFDIRGNLYPPKRIKLTIDQLESIFVQPFKSDSTRYEIFSSYLKFIEDFKEEVSPQFTHWINGSFISNRKNPNDIDFVSLIEHEVYQEKRALIDNKYRLAKAKAFYGVDAYTVEVYPENHKKSSICKSDLVYWDNWFGRTKKNWTKKSFLKGYIEIEF